MQTSSSSAGPIYEFIIYKSKFDSNLITKFKDYQHIRIQIHIAAVIILKHEMRLLYLVHVKIQRISRTQIESHYQYFRPYFWLFTKKTDKLKPLTILEVLLACYFISKYNEFCLKE